MKRILILFLTCIILILSMPLTALCAETQKTEVEYIDLSKTTISQDLKNSDITKYTKDLDKKNIEVITLSEQNYKRGGDLSSYAFFMRFIYAHNCSL